MVRSVLGRACAVTWLLVGCGPVIPYTSDEDTEGGTAALESSAGTPPGTLPTTGTTPPGSTTTSGVTTDAPNSDTRSEDVDVGSGSGMSSKPGLPLGSPCDTDAECAGGFCYPGWGPFESVCGECNQNSDCPSGGCTPPTIGSSDYAACDGGNFGEQCAVDSDCRNDLACAALLIDSGVPGGGFRSCSECATSQWCGEGELCSPVVGNTDIIAANVCIRRQSLELGQQCWLAGDGDQACISGHCAAFQLKEGLSIGVCSGCETDADCPGETRCRPPTGPINDPQPGACE